MPDKAPEQDPALALRDALGRTPHPVELRRLREDTAARGEVVRVERTRRGERGTFAEAHFADGTSRIFRAESTGGAVRSDAAPARPAERAPAKSVRVPRRTAPSSGRPRASATRSSAKSGDSGSDDDGPGDEPPPSAAAAVAAAWQRSLRERRPDLAWSVAYATRDDGERRAA